MAGGISIAETGAERIERRTEYARRCAWCLRFCVRGRWLEGRRDTDEAVLAATTHTICEDCIADLRRRGLTV